MQHVLREHGARFSAVAWDELIKERVQPALETGNVKQEDLVNLLRESEEHGGQHVFLYKTGHAGSMINETRVRQVLKTRGIEGVADKPRIVDKPTSPTVVDVRWEGTGNSKCLIVKVIETRTYQRQKRRPQTGKQIIIDLEDFSVRAVNLFRLNADGLLELRVEAYTNVQHYEDVVQRAWDVCGQILPRDSFEEESLARAEHNIWKNLSQLKDEIDYHDWTGRNEKGNTLRVATGSADTSLSTDPDSVGSINRFFLNNQKAFCERVNLRFKHRDGVSLPSRHLHVVLGTHPHEFAIRALSSRDDYEYVLGRLIQHNR